jgi:negative regulator of flagellin synthesis FlgM
MKIGKPAENQAPAAVATGLPGANGNAAAATAAGAAAPADPSAKIALSSTASTLMAGGTTAEFDADKVANISKAIDNGQYKINAGVIADKLISNAKELLGKVQS